MSIQITIPTPESLIIMMLALLLFGIGYDQVVKWLEARPRGHQGYTSLLVVVGSLIALIGAACVDGFESFFIYFVAFASAGLPMIAGSIIRYMRDRDQDARAMSHDAQERIQ